MADYSKLKVAELRDVLKERGIPSTGLTRKQQIVDALEAHDASQNETGEAGDAPAADVNTEGRVEEAVSSEGDGVVREDGVDSGPVEADQPREAGKADAEGMVGENMEDVGKEHAVTNGVEPDATSIPVSEVQGVSSSDAQPATIADEKMEDLTATPQMASPVSDGQSSENRKRKRRSPTPPPSEDTINKKLKAAKEEPVKLPNDDVVEKAPVPFETSSNPADSKEALPYSTSDDVMEVSDAPVATDPTSDLTNEAPASRNKFDGDMADKTDDTTMRAHSPLEDGTSGPSSVHPVTHSIYIRDLLRPLQPQQLRDHIVTLAARPGEEPDDSVITTLHLDNIRTHAFVSFASTSAASRVRTALHGVVWPDESTRKQLWVDYVPDEQVQDWIDREMESGNSKRDVRRWEVEYGTLNDGTVTASLQEITAPTGPRPRTSFSTQAPAPGQGVLNAPLGPRGHRPSIPTEHSVAPMASKQSPINSTPAPATSASFSVLDERFSSTTTKPKVYYLPVSSEIADKRLDTLDRETSRTWEGGRAMKTATGIEQQVRRYTFEDGDRLVDGGVEREHGYRGPGPGPWRGGSGGHRGGRGYGRGWR
ncbi:uncharacterized protein LTR77_001870 [Saxophila tyrrhenica]|uniref:SAP domain-containing protein n=1 Tax=Saxophila tyrrhenica TaxID=1690608 RepID=A0AAV9PR50_9PEZI|nr:hypothetical protein LTR77_001870 [Saxophila tyrrhenica]